MRAIILAGGRGRRLAPYTISFPKPLVPIGTMPILEIVIRQLKAAGFGRTTLAVGHLADLLQAYFQEGKRWGIAIDYSREFTPLGTIGPLKLIQDLPEWFLVMNGDILTTLDFQKLIIDHLDSGAEVTIATHVRTVPIDYGVLDYDGGLSLTGFREKPSLNYNVSMGIYVFRRSALDLVEAGEHCDLPDLLHRLMARQRTIKVHPSTDLWLDIGRTEDYERASQIFAENVQLFLPDVSIPSQFGSEGLLT